MEKVLTFDDFTLDDMVGVDDIVSPIIPHVPSGESLYPCLHLPPLSSVNIAQLAETYL